MSIAKTATLRQLATFRAVARLGSVSMAAEELHLSQSAVSIQLGSLESSAGAALVTRTGRGVRLTEAGELLLGYADRLLALWQETSEELASFLGDFTGTLRVGAVSTAEYWLPRFLVAFVKYNPKVKVKLYVANRQDIVRSLSAHEIDIAVVGSPPHEIAVHSAWIGSNPMAFVAAAQNPLTSAASLTLADMADARLLVRERGSGTRAAVERVFREAGLRLRVGSELSSNEGIKQMCAAGFGPAYLSLLTCILELNAGMLKILPLPGNPSERDWHVVHLPGRQLPQVAQAFEQFLALDMQATSLRAMWRHFAAATPKLARRRPRAAAA
jgi:LysR family transcriptional regulator, low CO2-responsive transcriptional regulator